MTVQALKLVPRSAPHMGNVPATNLYILIVFQPLVMEILLIIRHK